MKLPNEVNTEMIYLLEYYHNFIQSNQIVTRLKTFSHKTLSVRERQQKESGENQWTGRKAKKDGWKNWWFK